MTLAFANGSSNGNAGAASTSVTPAKTTAATGSGFVISANFDSARTLNSVADSKGNTYVLRGLQITDGPGGFKTATYLCPSGAGGSGHTATGTMDTIGLLSMYFGEITTTGGNGVTFDQVNQTNDTGSPFDSGNITTTVATELLVSFFGGNSGSPTATHSAAANSFTILTGADITDGVTQWTGAMASRNVSSTGVYSASWTEVLGTRSGVHIFSVSEASGTPATLSAPTPSGTLGTPTTATVGATSDQATGTFYAVLSLTNNVAAATGTQIKAGQNSTGAAAAFNSNSAISSTSPQTGFTGLTASTAYFYAAVQNNPNGDTNVVSGTFTTGTASAGSSGRLLLMGVG